MVGVNEQMPVLAVDAILQVAFGFRRFDSRHAASWVIEVMWTAVGSGVRFRADGGFLRGLDPYGVHQGAEHFCFGVVIANA